MNTVDSINQEIGRHHEALEVLTMRRSVAIAKDRLSYLHGRLETARELARLNDALELRVEINDAEVELQELTHILNANQHRLVPAQDTKPPLGVQPEFLVELELETVRDEISSDRCKVLMDAMKRYDAAGAAVPDGWIDELRRRLLELGFAAVDGKLVRVPRVVPAQEEGQ